MTAPTTDQLREMIAGTEGTTTGPWHYIPNYTSRGDLKAESIVSVGKLYDPVTIVLDVETGFLDAHHIARCDPATIRAMAKEIIAARETISRLANYVNDVALVVGSEHLLDLPEGIARKVKAAVLAEREACAKLADDYLRNSGALRLYVSAAIRARQENGT